MIKKLISWMHLKYVVMPDMHERISEMREGDFCVFEFDKRRSGPSKRTEIEWVMAKERPFQTLH
jgi:hypothetical protein